MMRNQHHFCMGVKEEKKWENKRQHTTVLIFLESGAYFIVYQVTPSTPAKIWVNITRIINWDKKK